MIANAIWSNMYSFSSLFRSWSRRVERRATPNRNHGQSEHLFESDVQNLWETKRRLTSFFHCRRTFLRSKLECSIPRLSMFDRYRGERANEKRINWRAQSRRVERRNIAYHGVSANGGATGTTIEMYITLIKS